MPQRRLALLAAALTFAQPVFAQDVQEQPATDVAAPVDNGLLCDQLAGSPADKNLPEGVKGVELFEIDVDQAQPACEAAWDEGKGLPRHGFNLARIYDQEGMFDEAKALYRLVAERDQVLAKTNLANILLWQGQEAAVILDEEAAAEGVAVSQYNLGKAFLEGWGVSADMGLALESLQAAADGGYRNAQDALGELYLDGKRVIADPVRARGYFEGAAGQGSVRAMLALGRIYRLGLGIEADADKARDYLQQALDAGAPNAAYQLALLTEEPAEADALFVTALEGYDVELASVLANTPETLPEHALAALRDRLHIGADGDLGTALRAFYAEGAVY